MTLLAHLSSAGMPRAVEGVLEVMRLRHWIIAPLAAIAALVGVLLLAADPSTTASNDGEEESGTTASPPDASEGPEILAVTQIPGDEREDVPSALDDMNDPSFPAPLVDPGEIRSGGPPPDGIPPIDEPRFEVASTVDWLDGVEPVLLVAVGGETRAYPVQIMTWHEIVNDTFGDTPIAVSYCPLCNSALVYHRAIDDQILDFGTSGRLYNSSLVMYDRQTESLWSHFTGQAVVGELTGTALETLPVSTVSWATFREAHPDSLVLSRETGFSRDYGRNPYPGYDNVNQTPFLFDGEVDGRLAAQTRVVAVRGASETIAVPLDDLAEAGAITASVDGEDVVLLHAPGTASALDASNIAGGRDVGAVGVYRSDVAGTAVSLEASGDGTFTDTTTGSSFDILGAGTSGELEATQLEPVEHLDTFWFAIAAFEPETRIVTG